MYAYGPYGEALAHAGTTEQPFRYNGRDGVITDAYGLYHMRARYYNPDIKRFINRDVLRGMLDATQTLNRYAYVNGNPISYIDPFGLSRDGDSIWLQGGSFLLDALPYVGTVKGFQQAFSGVNHVTGGKLSTSERWSEGVGSALSLVPIPGLKHVGKYGTEGIIGLGWTNGTGMVAQQRLRLDLQFFGGKGVGNVISEVSELGSNKIHHILQDKHAWDKVVTDKNNWDEVSKVISNAMVNGTESSYKKSALKKSMSVNGQVVEVTFVRLQNGTIKISDAWVKTK